MLKQNKNIKIYHQLNWKKVILKKVMPGICAVAIGFSAVGCSKSEDKQGNTIKIFKSSKPKPYQQIELPVRKPKKEKELLPTEIQLDVKDIMQNPELPNGCEITSATIVLQYLGYDVSKLTMADCYLDQSSHWQGTNPEEMYMGNPRYSSGSQCGWYCLAGPIVEAVNEYLEDETEKTLGPSAEIPYQAVDFTGISIEELKQQLAKGNPLVVWITMGPFREPRYIGQGYYNEQGEFIAYYTGLHCITVTGYTESTYYLTDPIYGKYEIEKEKFEDIWVKMGQRAVGIIPVEQLEKSYQKNLVK